MSLKWSLFPKRSPLSQTVPSGNLQECPFCQGVTTVSLSGGCQSPWQSVSSPGHGWPRRNHFQLCWCHSWLWNNYLMFLSLWNVSARPARHWTKYGDTVFMGFYCIRYTIWSVKSQWANVDDNGFSYGIIWIITGFKFLTQRISVFKNLRMYVSITINGVAKGISEITFWQ